MRQHRLTSYVADRQDMRVGRALRFITLHEAFGIDLHLGVFEPKPAARGAPPYRNENTIVALCPEFARSFKGDFDLVALQSERTHFRVEINALLEQLIQ